MIEAKNIDKKFGNIHAVNSLSFAVERGEFFGFLGPNGAGKTTTINMLSTILVPDSGEVWLNGVNSGKEPVRCRKMIGVVPQEIALYDDLTALDNLKFWGSLYDIPSSVLKDRIIQSLELIGLEKRKNDRISTFSGGMKRRVNIACALLHEPDILFMDEPTVGIDPQSRIHIYEILEKLHQKGKTIIYTTHYMEEAERMCDRIAIIDHGKIIARGTMDELRAKGDYPGSIVVGFQKEGNLDAETLGEKFGERLQMSDSSFTVHTNDPDRELQEVISATRGAGVKIQHINIRKANLESIFLQLTGRELRD